MHPLVARVARVFGREESQADAESAAPPAVLIHPGYWQEMDAERATSPAGDASEAEWQDWLTMTARDAGHDLAAPFGPDHPEWRDWLTLLETTPDNDPWQRLGEWEHTHAHELER